MTATLDRPARAAAPRRGLVFVYSALALANVVAWAWALTVARGAPVLLGAAGLAYLLGLRHAVDADHIAAIDNATRRMMQAGRRPVSVGAWFSLGHSTVVVVACAAIAVAAAPARPWLARLGDAGASVGTSVSASFLFLIALANLGVLAQIVRQWRSRDAAAAEPPAPAGGLLWRWLQPLLATADRPARMYPVGLLFGLGFDTASEVGLLVIAAAQAVHHLPPAAVMVLPALFAAGMTLVDTTDGVLMVGAYGWALAEPRRRLAYNAAVTGLSIAAALVIGAAEVAGMLRERLGAAIPDWGDALNAHAGLTGCAIIAALAATWAATWLIGRPRRRGC